MRKHNVQTLNTLMLNLEEGQAWDYQFVLVGNNQVEPLIEANAASLSFRGGIMQKFAANEAIYAKHAAKYGFQIRSKINYYDLKNYELYFFTSTTEPKSALLALKNRIEAELAQMGFNPQLMSAEDLIGFVHDHLNFSLQQTAPTQLDYNPFDCIHQQVMSPNTQFVVHDDSVATQFTALQKNQELNTQVVSLGLKKLPQEMRLYQLPEMLASLLNPEKSLLISTLKSTWMTTIDSNSDYQPL